MNKIVKVISYFGIGGVCFIAGRQYSLLEMEKALTSDWAKRELRKRLGDQLDKYECKK